MMHPVVKRIWKRLSKGIGLVRLTKDHTWLARFNSLFPSWGRWCRKHWGKAVPGALAVVLLTLAWVTVPETSRPLWETVSRQDETKSPWKRDMLGWTVLAPVTGSVDSADDTRIYYVDPDTGNDGTAVFVPAGTPMDPENPTDVEAPSPYATLPAAIAVANSRQGKPDWVMVKRGTEHGDGSQVNIKTWTKVSGASFRIGCYGSETIARPVMNYSIRFDGGGGRTNPVEQVAITGLDIHAWTHDPDDPRWADPTANFGDGIQIGGTGIGGNRDVLIEDVRVRFAQVNLRSDTVPDYTAEPPTGDGLTVRRSTFMKNWQAATSGHQQGIFIDDWNNWLIEDNVFWHNGWASDLLPPGAASPHGGVATIFNHNVYVTERCTSGIFRGNITADASSHGIQQRPGGINERNLYISNPLASFLANNDSAVYNHESRFTQNVVIGTRDINGAGRRSGLTLQGRTATISDCLVVDSDYTGAGPYLQTGEAFGIGGSGPLPVVMTIDNCIAYKWDAEVSFRIDIETTGLTSWALTNTIFYAEGTDQDWIGKVADSASFGMTLDSNTWFWEGNAAGISTWMRVDGPSVSPLSWATTLGETNQSTADPSGAWPDPGRTIDTYMSSIGETSTYEAFIGAAVENRKGDWDWRYTATPAIDHIRAGFGRSEVSKPDGYFGESSGIAYRGGSTGLILLLGS
jgi:hypothetical protein